MMSPFVLVAAIGYGLGSIPFGYVLVRMIRGQDIRDSGSGNIGATNVSRTSPVLGVVTLLLDALKGVIAVVVAHQLLPESRVGAAVAALAAVAGHIFPIWLKFRGGKGVATGLGAFLVIAPKAVLITAGIFFAIVTAFRYVSLGSVIAVAAFPVLAWFLGTDRDLPAGMALIVVASLLIIVKHHENIRRLLSGTENRLRWGRG